ncbi:MAG TPA: serine hydrolase [Vicinamibacterales bacterium]|nr:serine hydrolase [Vicinamibacterales bacterium]
MRVIRPLHALRLCAFLLGIAVCLPAQAAATSRPQKKTTTKSSVAAKKSRQKPVYSASTSQARKARLARAREAARARESARMRALQEAMTPRFKTDANGLQVPDVRAAASIAFNPKTGEVLWQENAQDKRPIASITKVMTAVVFLEDDPDLTQEVTVERSDVYAASTTYLRANDRLTLSNVLHLTLIASDNAAARVLARVSHGGTASFVERMNEKAVELGLENTSFADPSGLNAANLSSAYDLSRLISLATSDERIAPIMRTQQYTVNTTRRAISIHSTNRLLTDSGVEVVGGKTGFISKAGYCLATLLHIPQSDQTVAFVVLGAKSNTGRFWETRHLFNWVSTKAADIFRKEQQ